jgi:hypothetical protein
MRTAWAIAAGLLPLVIVLYVFSHLEHRFEIIVVAILGASYATIGINNAINGYAMVVLGALAEREFTLIRKRLGDDEVSGRKKEFFSNMEGNEYAVGWLLTSSFLILLVCLYHLFHAL